MYSIYFFLKDGTNVELFIGSAYDLGFIYQPARLLKLDLIYNFSEESDLYQMKEFAEFIQQIGYIVMFWKNNENHIDNNRPNIDFINRLDEFYSKIKNISLSEILSISIF